MKATSLLDTILVATLAATASSFATHRQVAWVGPLSSRTTIRQGSQQKRGKLASLASSTESNDSSVRTGEGNTQGGPPRRGPPNPNRGPPQNRGPQNRSTFSRGRNGNQSGGQQQRRQGFRPGQGQGQGQGRGRPGGGYASPPLSLENPLKLQRVQVTPPPRPPRPPRDGEQRQQRGGPRQQRQSPAGAASNRPRSSPVGRIDNDGKTSESSFDERKNRGSFDRDGDAPGMGDNKGTRRGPGGGKPVRKEKKSYNGDKPKKTSLRIGTGKRGRGAELSMRRSSLKKRDRTKEKERKEEAALERRTVSLPEGPLTVQQLAEIIDERPVSVIKFLMTDLGVMASMTQSLDPGTCVAVVEGMGKVVSGADDEDFDEDFEDDEDSVLSVGVAIDEDDPEDLLPRAPVVTIMGHVDHGKTSLLDAIRDTRVTAGEAGGITQHIGAYQVEHNGKPITFIDTPGHAAFTDMRERGANITDIVILVVAADDGVKQQTADSIMCARQAGVPLIVAVNKCDLETADPSRVKSDLTGYEVLTEDLGGEVMCSEVSAKEGTNLDDLLDKIMLQAEVQDLKANPNRNAQGVVVEARVERGLGTIATTLIQRGTLKIGDVFVAGETWGKVRALIGSDGKTRFDEAGPSLPVSVVGFDGVPAAGDVLITAENEQVARELAENRQRIARERESSSYQAGLMSSVAATFGGSGFKEKREMCVVVKADVQGSAEALTRSLSELKLEDEEAVVTVKVLVSEAGDVTKSDIAIASVTPGTTVIAFNCAANFAAMEDARALGVPIEYYNIVYDAIDSVESRMQEVLSPTPEGQYVGSAVVQEVFNIGGTGNIAGSKCKDGFLRKGSNVRVMRGDKILIESKIRSLRNFKEEVDQIEEGNECGIGLMDFEDYEPGDVIESYVEK